MYHGFTFEDCLATSSRTAWTIEEVIPADARLDFSRPFLPETLARTAREELSPEERLTLNQIRGHEYLSMFGLVEEFILPFVLDHARHRLDEDDVRVRALLAFAGEEAKHIHLFRIFQQRFASDFKVPCGMIGPAAAIGAEVLRHHPLAVALLILQVEWMTQSHYLESVRDDAGIDPLFKSLLRHHWIEEAQHAKLDTLMVEALAEGMSAHEIENAIEQYVEIVEFVDAGLKTQCALNLDALEAATGRALDPKTRERVAADQRQAIRWTYLGSGIDHPNFTGTLAGISPAGAARVAALAPLYR